MYKFKGSAIFDDGHGEPFTLKYHSPPSEALAIFDALDIWRENQFLRFIRALNMIQTEGEALEWMAVTNGRYLFLGPEPSAIQERKHTAPF